MGPRDDLARDESPVTSGAFENCSPDFGLGAYQNKSGSRRHLVLERWIESQSVNQGAHACVCVCIVQCTWAATHSHIPSLAGPTGYPISWAGQAQIRTWSWHQDLHSTPDGGIHFSS